MGCCYRMYSLISLLRTCVWIVGVVYYVCFLFYEGMGKVDVTIVFIERYNVIK